MTSHHILLTQTVEKSKAGGHFFIFLLNRGLMAHEINLPNPSKHISLRKS